MLRRFARRTCSGALRQVRLGHLGTPSSEELEGDDHGSHRDDPLTVVVEHRIAEEPLGDRQEQAEEQGGTSGDDRGPLDLVPDRGRDAEPLSPGEPEDQRLQRDATEPVVGEPDRDR